jgi:AraC-like DNA-binding protein
MYTNKVIFDVKNPDVSLSKAIAKVKRYPKPPNINKEIIDNLLFVQSYADVEASYPHHYDISNLDSFSLIYTEAGAGRISFNSRSYIMKKETVMFINCKHCHTIEIKIPLWKYKIFFISGPSVSFFYNNYIEDGENLHTFLPDSLVPDKINFLYDNLSNPHNVPLVHSRYIYELLFELLIEKSRLRKEHCTCDYIYQIKHDFDFHYMDDISLEFLEQKYHVSKSHICREFKKRFLMTPIQYQNYRKIEVSKRMLLNTDMRINEIGRMVGFENPNNFIRNFKKHTAVTPSEYRKQHIADILVPSSRI